jgi:hypothetical protein
MGMAFDPTTSRVILDAGTADNGVYFADTWALQVPQTLPTATLISVESALSGPSGVRLRWRVSATTGTPCTVERSSDGTSWAAAGAASWTGSDVVAFSDAALAAGVREAYRLRVGGIDATTSDAVWLTGASSASAALAVAPLTNPSRGAPALRLSLREGSPARVRLLDVSGRVVGESQLAAGTQSWTPGVAPSPGLYFAELVQGRERRVARVVVAP